MIPKLVLLICNLLTLAALIKVDTNSSLFLDQFARYRIYHGVNVVYKLQPFHPNLVEYSSNHSLTDEDLYNLKHWGMNVIRLHVAWEGLEPQKGVYNYTYVETLRQIMRKCNNFGISVLLDAHQDLFVRQFCGEGLPTWTAERESFPAPLNMEMKFDQNRFPHREDCLKILFAKFYLTFDVMKLQKDLFTNQRNLLDHFCKFWQIIVENLKDEPNLIGYQFINEPIGFDTYMDPAGTLLPGQANNNYLLPAYKRIYEAIRKHDKRTPIYFQPSTVDLLGGGFLETPGGPNELERQVFSYHIYCPIVTNLGQPIYPLFCDYFAEQQTLLKQQNLKKLKIGGFLTQFGAVSNSDISAHQITTIANQMQKHFRSWAYWQFKYYEDITTLAMPGTTEAFYDQQGNLQLNKIKALARPYAYAICGTPLKETLQEGVFSLSWVASNSCFDYKTELFLSQALYYPNGFSVNYSSNCRGCELRLMEGQTKNFYEIEIGHSQGEQITVTILPL